MCYDQFASKYDKAIAPFEKRFLSKWRQEALSHVPETSTILEIGAGTGLNFRFYPKSNHAVAIEISSEMIRFAIPKIANKTISLVQTDAEVLPFADNSFDAAFATLVFCAIPNPENAFAELRRVVKTSGRVVLLEHVRPSGLLGYLFDVFSFFAVWLFEDNFNRETAKIAAASGLKILDVKTKFFGIVNLIICENRKNTFPN